MSCVVTQLSPAPLCSGLLARSTISCLRVGELSLEVAVPEVQRDLGLVGGHLVAGAAHRVEGELGVLPLGGVARRLSVDRVRLPGLASHLNERDKELVGGRIMS